MVARAVSTKRNGPPALLYAEGSVVINRAGAYDAAAPPQHVICFNDLFRTAETRGGAPDFSAVSAALFLTFCYNEQVLRPLLEHKVKMVVAANFKGQMGAPAAGAPVKVHVITCADKKLKATFHPKLFLVRFRDFLRVVVGSGNLFSEDWTVFGNCFYVRDFALLAQPVEAPRSQFQLYLREYLGEVFGAKLAGHLATLGIDLLRYDMDGECPLLLGSTPGNYGLAAPHHGFPLLLSQMRAHPPGCAVDPATLRITCLTSSMGSLNLFFLHTLAHCLVPGLPFAKQSLKALPPTERAAFLDMFHIVFPTEEYVERAQATPDCLFFRKSTYESFSFERSVLSLYNGDGRLQGDDRVVPHYKVIIVTFAKDFGITDDTVLYLGSHNFTQAAWGRSSNFDQRFTVWNFELGAVFPPRPGSAQRKREIIARLGFAFPPQRYSQFDTPFFNQL